MKRFGIKTLLLMAACASFTACEDLIYDGEGDCSTSYSVRFRYDRNMSFADAFGSQVQTVTLCAFGSDGVLDYTKTESAEVISQNGQAMDVNDITPGRYTFVAWAQGENRNADSYLLVTPTVGQTRLADLTARIKRDADGGVDNDLTPLFHGILTNQDFTALLNGGERTVEIPLTKNTNVVRVVLQNQSGEDLNAGDFRFTITDDNGWMNYDNSLLDDETLTYSAWFQTSGSADINGHTGVSAVVAELTTGRLMANHEPVLTVSRVSDGKTVLSIPLVKYVLLVKGQHNSGISDQEYLDREDEYDMTFFLGSDGSWISSQIIINDWVLKLDEFSF